MNGSGLLKRLRQELVGLDTEVPTLSGQRRRYVSLDNASSTPTFRPIVSKVDEFLGYYANVHRGSGFKSQLASWAFETARHDVARFVKADLNEKTVIFTKNTTESINRLSRLYPFRPDGVIITSTMEHHSNDLPWRRVAKVVHVGVKADGSLDVDDYLRKLKEYAGKVDLVTMTGASNVSGWVTPYHYLARLAHEAGAKFVLDAAQLAPHRPVDMKPSSDPEHIDYLAFSAHKMYAPYGIGALVGDRKPLLAADPDMVGGGVVDIVTIEGAYWRELPEREEAGTPDIVGVVALAAAIRLLEAVGWSAIQEHEERLARRLLTRLAEVPEMKIYGQNDPVDVSGRLGVVAFNVGKIPYALVAAILSYEHGIGVRTGCFCAHPYMLCLLDVQPQEATKVRDEILSRDRTNVPGAVRASVGLYNDESDIDALVEALKVVQRGGHSGSYVLCKETGSYVPTERDCFEFDSHFTLTPHLPS
ncbi:aminotransferase class V-fold PLP-dependent enzyme [candidate division WOR-3 bacterium]|nr:aminotransferase class V-fold PLP-dependent enzyme [candidate division WOR-3 bacterium]